VNLFKGINRAVNIGDLGFFSALIFGIIFSVGWTPCVGAFLGSALMLASQQGHVLTGMIMLLMYSVGLGIPFIISAVLIDQLKNTFSWIKRNYRIINAVCGSFLIVIGVLMAAGMMGRFLALFN
jgi:cytochrome c-type biogenesis protein